MKIIFFGLGSIGQKQVRILLKEYNYELFAFRTNKGQKDSKLPIKEIHSWEKFEVIKPDVAFITNPPVFHIETAIKCAQHKCALFIEKPLCSTLYGLDQLLELVQLNNLVTYVAYNLRFHPVVTYLKKYTEKYPVLHIQATASSYLPNWRPGQNHKKIYSSHSELGGGVIFDLSHEIDYVQYLLGGIDSLHGQFGRAADLTIDTEDFADIVVKASGTTGNIHINFLSHYPERKIRVDFKDFSIIGDLRNGVVRKYQNEKVIEEKSFNIDMDFTYKKQIQYFFDNINNSRMMNNFYESSSLLKKILDFKERGSYG